mmetsp:Transcript_57189/g.125167  ORF Transcript_57189/g.125167 Transcript_57189/m.125167 type:complete len:292 (-) Transcript_57189:319-1194(-)
MPVESDEVRDGHVDGKVIVAVDALTTCTTDSQRMRIALLFMLLLLLILLLLLDLLCLGHWRWGGRGICLSRDHEWCSSWENAHGPPPCGGRALGGVGGGGRRGHGGGHGRGHGGGLGTAIRGTAEALGGGCGLALGFRELGGLRFSGGRRATLLFGLVGDLAFVTRLQVQALLSRLLLLLPWLLWLLLGILVFFVLLTFVAWLLELLLFPRLLRFVSWCAFRRSRRHRRITSDQAVGNGKGLFKDSGHGTRGVHVGQMRDLLPAVCLEGGHHLTLPVQQSFLDLRGRHVKR